MVLIPFIQGGVFRLNGAQKTVITDSSLNPFHTGRGLSTSNNDMQDLIMLGLNPFHTGRGLSTVGILASYNSNWES